MHAALSSGPRQKHHRAVGKKNAAFMAANPSFCTEDKQFPSLVQEPTTRNCNLSHTSVKGTVTVWLRRAWIVKGYIKTTATQESKKGFLFLKFAVSRA